MASYLQSCAAGVAGWTSLARSTADGEQGCECGSQTLGHLVTCGETKRPHRGLNALTSTCRPCKTWWTMDIFNGGRGNHLRSKTLPSSGLPFHASIPFPEQGDEGTAADLKVKSYL